MEMDVFKGTVCMQTEVSASCVKEVNKGAARWVELYIHPILNLTCDSLTPDESPWLRHLLREVGFYFRRFWGLVFV